jgi:hypothetical protein
MRGHRSAGGAIVCSRGRDGNRSTDAGADDVGVYPFGSPPGHGDLIGGISDGEPFAVGSDWEHAVASRGDTLRRIIDYAFGYRPRTRRTIVVRSRSVTFAASS